MTPEQRTRKPAGDGGALWAWAAVAAWAAVVLTASGESFAASRTLTWVS